MRLLFVGLSVGGMVLSSFTACGGDDFESTKDVGTGGVASGAGPENCATGQVCTFQSDCPSGQRCNSSAAKCIHAVVDEFADDCSQTPCTIGVDCPDNYACSLTTGRCFKK